MTKPIAELRDVHTGETAYVIGRGRSLLDLRAEMIGPGPVIALNLALVHVRALNLPNPIYSMQKDGCVALALESGPRFIFLGDQRPCSGPPCVDGSPLAEPMAPETLLVSQAGSWGCFPDYAPRYIFGCESDFGIPWYTMSAPVAVRIAALMGCTLVVMIGHDAFVSGDTHRVERDGSMVDAPHEGYANAGHASVAVAAELKLTLEWPSA
jgi:hypothetical protein